MTHKRNRSKITGRFLKPGILGQIEDTNKRVYKPLTEEDFKNFIKQFK